MLPIARESRFGPGAGGDGSCRSGARPTSPRAGPTAATAAAAATSFSLPTTGCATCSPSAAARTSGPMAAVTERGPAPRRGGRQLVDARPAGHGRSRSGRPSYDLSSRAGGHARPRRAGGRGNKRFADRRPDRRPRFRERACPVARAGSSCSSSCSPTSGSSGCRTPASPRCWPAMTRARPKVGGYPFTTLEPVLGTMETAERQLIVADIPGLIEGASAGAGLGHEFLAHVERTRLLVHVLDLAPLDGTDPEANLAIDRGRARRPRSAARRAAARARALEGRPRQPGGARRRRRALARARRRRDADPGLLERHGGGARRAQAELGRRVSRRHRRWPSPTSRTPWPSIASSGLAPARVRRSRRSARTPTASRPRRRAARRCARTSTTRRRSPTSSSGSSAWA